MRRRSSWSRPKIKVKLTLKRISQGPGGTFGVLLNDQFPLCTTCEPNWNDNLPGDDQTPPSCIPAGVYTCIPHDSQKHPNVWEISNVQGRTAILIHEGNTTKDTEGCVLAGNGFNIFGQVPGVINSDDTISKLRKILPPTFTLEIINP